MGLYESYLRVKEPAISTTCNPSMRNWITIHADALGMTVAEVERVWERFKQLGCNDQGELSLELGDKKTDLTTDIFVRNLLKQIPKNERDTITFEQFLLCLKWFEDLTEIDKSKVVFNYLNGGNQMDQEFLERLLKRIYPNETEAVYSSLAADLLQGLHSDDGSTPHLSEEKFVQRVMQLPDNYTAPLFTFSIIPHELIREAHTPSFAGNEPEASTSKPGMAFPMRPAGSDPRNQQKPESRPSRARDTVVPDTVLPHISRKVTQSEWLPFAEKLGFADEDLIPYRQQYPYSEYDQLLSVLREWKRKNGDEATCKRLESILHECKMHDAAFLLEP